MVPGGLRLTRPNFRVCYELVTVHCLSVTVDYVLVEPVADQVMKAQQVLQDVVLVQSPLLQ